MDTKPRFASTLELVRADITIRCELETRKVQPWTLLYISMEGDDWGFAVFGDCSTRMWWIVDDSLIMAMTEDKHEKSRLDAVVKAVPQIGSEGYYEPKKYRLPPEPSAEEELDVEDSGDTATSKA